jgi:RimJ/RimL family protein N-acetyltransferase
MSCLLACGRCGVADSIRHGGAGVKRQPGPVAAALLDVGDRSRHTPGMDTPCLTDGAIALDGYTAADTGAHLAGEDEEQARRFGWFPARSTPDTVAAAIAGWQRDWADDSGRHTFALRLLPGRDLAGGCEVRCTGDGCAEMSYWVFPAFRGRGLAARAVRLAADWAAAGLGTGVVRLAIEPDNAASMRVAAAAGFAPAGRRTEDGSPMLLFERRTGSGAC